MNSALLSKSKQELIALLEASGKKTEAAEQKSKHAEQIAAEAEQKTERAEKKAEEAEQKVKNAEQRIVSMEFQIHELQRLLFGAKRERFICENPDQLCLPFAVDEQQASAVVEEQVTISRKKAARVPHPGRHAFPAHLPVEEIILEPEADTEGMTRIGEEVTEELDITPARLFVRRYIRPKYASNKEERPILIAEAPNRALPKCQAAPGLLAQLLVDKFVDHLPVYRQRERFKRQDVDLPASTIDSWQRQTALLLEPLYACQKDRVLQQGYLQVDETPIRVLDRKKKGKSHRGYHWVYHSPLEKTVLFDYRPGRGRDGPAEMLENFTGYLQTDGYTVYEQFGERPPIRLIYCWAHARRYFEKALAENRQAAETVMLHIQKLYAIERKLREAGANAEDIHSFRLDESLPILNALGKWLADNTKRFVPKSLMGKACQYTIKRWDGLLAYLYDGSLQIDNNLIENTIRPNALGRKNYLFCGSHEGAQRAAMMYSFFGTCKLHGIDPYVWLKHTLEHIAEHPINRIHELLPQYFSQP